MSLYRSSHRKAVPRLTWLAVMLLCGTHFLRAQAPSSDATFRVGLKSIAIPAPSSELIETGSDYRVTLELLAPTNNRLVAAFLLPNELKALQTGDSSISRYALVEVSRRAEFATVTPELYKQVADSMGQQFGAAVDSTLKDQQEEINRRLKVLATQPTSVTLDKPLMLGSLFSKQNASGYGAIMPVSTNGKTTKVVMGVAVLRAQDRLLFLYLYTPYEDEKSVDWTRTTVEKWADSLLKMN
jgi:hypothetical protein